MSHPCGSTHSLSPRPVRPHRRRLHWRLLRSEAYAYLLSLILCQQSDVVAPDATRELWLQQIPKTRMALETLSTKRRKSAIARDAVSPNLSSCVIVEVNMEFPRRSGRDNVR